MVRHRIWWLLLMCVVLGVLIWRQHQAICHAPILYSLGHIDAQFGLSDSAVRAALKQAEHLWENALGRNLFEYSATAKLTINFVFDERQHATRVKERLLSRLQQAEASHADLAQAYSTWRGLYQDKRKAYEAARMAYEARVQAYNAQVQQWNARGGPPAQVRQTLAVERTHIEAGQRQLAADQSELQDIIATLKELEDRDKTLIEMHTRQVQSYNALHGEHRHFHKGEYDGKEITIYQYQNLADLVLILAHELGHALGLAHVDDPKAVMHEILSDQDLDTLTLTSADVRALHAACSRK
jgi:predicted Zn-dependent protease